MTTVLRSGVAALLLVLVTAGTATAGPKAEAQVREHTKKAMEHFDMLEYEQARKLLLEAVVLAKKNHLERSKALAEAYMYLGIVYFAGLEDIDSAKLAFMDAVSIDPSIQLDDAYRTAEMRDLLEEVRAEAGVGSGGGKGKAASGGCDALTGVQHVPLDTAPAGADRTVTAKVAPSLQADRVVLYYRADGSTEFRAVPMQRSGACDYEAAIPGKALHGPWVHYFIAAENAAGKAIAASGSRQSPHLLEVTGADEVPDVLAGGGARGRGDGDGDAGADASVGATATAGGDTVFLSVAAGSGGGYVSGTTEQLNADVGCCFAPAVFHLFSELGVYLSPQLTLSAAFRMGFPLDANREEASTGAPGALVRVRYAPSATGAGVVLSGGIGGGVIRHTVKLTPPPADGKGDIDTAASGPLLVAGGVGYRKPLGGPVAFIAEINAIAGIPVVDEFQGVQPNFAVELDVNLGLQFGF